MLRFIEKWFGISSKQLQQTLAYIHVCVIYYCSSASHHIKIFLVNLDSQHSQVSHITPCEPTVKMVQYYQATWAAFAMAKLFQHDLHSLSFWGTADRCWPLFATKINYGPSLILEDCDIWPKQNAFQFSKNQTKWMGIEWAMVETVWGRFVYFIWRGEGMTIQLL